jgi:hypothetical protein
MTEATAAAAGAVPGSDVQAQVRLGDYFAEVLLVDRAPMRPKPEPNPVGGRPVQRWSASSVTATTASHR